MIYTFPQKFVNRVGLGVSSKSFKNEFIKTYSWQTMRIELQEACFYKKQNNFLTFVQILP